MQPYRAIDRPNYTSKRATVVAATRYKTGDTKIGPYEMQNHLLKTASFRPSPPPPLARPAALLLRVRSRDVGVYLCVRGG